MDEQHDLEFESAHSILESLFAKDLLDPEKYDPEVVALVTDHLWLPPIHSQAGARLAAALVELAKNRAAGGRR